jgi:subtilisin family serine protease
MTFSAAEILKAVQDGVDVLNFSWVRHDNANCLEDAIKTALASGVVCVAAAGNNQPDLPLLCYPAAYNFGELGQVIAVSATKLNGDEEEFFDGWNYSPGFDPIEDPINSFADVAAPGSNIAVLERLCCSGYSVACGTSLAAPFVSALVGLMLSLDSTLTSYRIYKVLTETADKVGQYPYDKNGWNQYLGYGRINAYKALQAIQKPLDAEITDENNIINNIVLYQNYPNPFNPTTTIKYSIPVRVNSESAIVKNVILRIFDILGREVAILVNEKQKPGNYEVEFEGTNCSSGIYYYRLQIFDYAETKKMVILK